MPLLEVDAVSVRFGGIRALDAVTLSVEPAQVTGLIGPNGAGKSTMLSVLSGLQRPAAGSVHMDGHDITTAAPHRRAALGMARTFQRLELWESMSVRENVKAAAEFSRRWRKRVDVETEAESVLDRLGLSAVADRPVGSLPSGLARVVEVARALASKPRLLLLDEPSAGLDEAESQRLGATLVEVAAEGTAVVLVEHHMEMVMNSCDYLWVLDFGHLIGRGTPEQVRSDAKVQAAYLGSGHVGSA